MAGESHRRAATATSKWANLGLNDGPAAGQTMPQLHFHVIPRYTGDVPDPCGGKSRRGLHDSDHWSPDEKEDTARDDAGDGEQAEEAVFAHD